MDKQKIYKASRRGQNHFPGNDKLFTLYRLLYTEQTQMKKKKTTCQKPCINCLHIFQRKSKFFIGI